VSTRTYYCPDCEGWGSTWTSPSGCMNDPGAVDHHCLTCDGQGLLELDPLADDTDNLRPYTPSRRRWKPACRTPQVARRNPDPLERIGKLRGLVRQYGRKSGATDDYALELAWLHGRKDRHERAAAILAKLRAH
jgi:hypothetical protein